MESLYGYIGLSSCLSEVESGLYLDGLPDVSLTLVEKLQTEEVSDITEFWTKIEKRGILKFRTLFINAVNKCHQISKVDICECLIEENFAILGTSLWYLLGAELMFERVNSTRLNRYTTIEKSKARELRNEFMQIFTDELEVAVNSIDVHTTECTEDEIPEHNISTFVTVHP